MPSKHELEIRMKLRDEASKRLGVLKREMKQFADTVKTYWKAIAASMLAVGYALAKVVKDSVAYGVKIDEMSKQSGIAAEDFSRLAYAAEQEHASLESITKIMPLLAKYMYSASQGMVTYSREFDKMGVKVTDTKGKLRSTYDVFLDMSEYYKNATNKTEALALAMRMLGRRGEELVPLLKLGKDGIKKLGDEAERLGIVLDQETASKMEEFDDTVVKLQTSLKGLGIMFTKYILPAVKDYAYHLDGAIESQRKMMDVRKIEKYYKVLEDLQKAQKKHEKFKSSTTGFGKSGIKGQEEQIKKLSREASDLAIVLRGMFPIDEKGLSDWLTDEDVERLQKTAVYLEKISVGRGEGNNAKKDSWMRETFNQFQKHANLYEEAAKGMYEGMAGSMKTFFTDAFHGELKTAEDYFRAFGDVLVDIAAEMAARLLIYMTVLKPLFGGTDLGPAFGLPGATPAPAGAEMHTGGRIRPVYTAHKGLAVDEVMIKAQTGEGVLNRRGMSALGMNNFNRLNTGGNMGGGQTVQYITNNYIQANDAKSFSDMLKASGGTIQEISLKAKKNSASYRAMDRKFS